MGIALWVVQGLLAAASLTAGATKLSQPKEKLAKNMAWVEDFSQNLPGAEGGDFFLVRGSYANHMLRPPEVRPPEGWRIEASRNTSAGPKGTTVFPRRPQPSLEQSRQDHERYARSGRRPDLAAPVRRPPDRTP